MKHKTNKTENYYKLRDLARNLEYGDLKSDRRIQVKMPSNVVEALDLTFPHIDRSKLLTKLAIQALLDNKLKDPRDSWASFADMEDATNQDLLGYLEERETNYE